MSKSEEIKRLEADLRASAELRDKLNDICRRISGEGEFKSDSEVFANAASGLGYDISAADIERAAAEAEELDLNELAMVSGGGEADEDFCITAWHCYTAMIHDSNSNKTEACWSNFNCIVWSN